MSNEDKILSEGPLVMSRNQAVQVLAQVANDKANTMSDVQLKSFAQLLGKSFVKKGSKYVIEDTDPCWKGYKMVGKKKKDGRDVPNCVPVDEDAAPAAANAVGHGGVDMNPNGKKTRLTQKPMRRFKDFAKRWEDAGRN